MNETTRPEPRKGLHPALPPRRRSVEGRRDGAARASVEDEIGREALRLLSLLGAPDARVVSDAFDPGLLVVTRRQGLVSLPAGRFRVEAGEALARRDLARFGSAHSSLALTDAGAAYLRRRAVTASDPEASPFIAQHVPTVAAVVEGPEGPATVRVDVEEGPLDWLRRRKGADGEPLIDDTAFAVGERLRRDITLAGLLPSVTSRWDAPRGGGGPGEATDAMIAARQRLRSAFTTVGGDFADLLLDLCGFGKGIARIEADRGWPPRSGKVAIRLALARLAEHYGLAREAIGPQGSRGIRAWQALSDPGEVPNALPAPDDDMSASD